MTRTTGRRTTGTLGAEPAQMNLQVGIGSFRDLEYYLREGAAELYCGLEYIPSHVEGARNFASTGEILKAAALARAAGAKMFFAANEVHAALLERTAGVIAELAGGGIDGVIIRDLALLDLLRRRRIRTPLILSTLSCCLNAAALGFYRRYGVTRLALPEQLLPAEAAELVRNRWGIGTEVFLKARECCRNFNGLCFLECRGKDSNTCKKKFRLRGRGFVMPAFSPAEHLAQLHDYHRLGVGTLKVGRSPVAEISRVIFAEGRLLAGLLAAGLSRERFTAEALRVRTAMDRAYLRLKEGF
ncbi:MAG: U32 family peptidase [Elusimicrobia bacterium]|nr:U32 family peptidase [Elusimicrobiota bacterium]